MLPSSHLDVESQAFQSSQVRSASDILQMKLINRWLNKNVIVQKRQFVQARHGNIKDEYFFEKKVGQGGFGVVYKAKNRLTQKRVAIKAVHKSKITDMTGFIREYQILSKLDHPNILNIREIWEWEKMLFIVTDYCQGGDLFAYMLERNQLAEHEVSLLMNQCVGALNYLSQNGICHRDIKLENIMLQRDGDLANVKLIDFGLSRDIGASGTVKSLCSGTPFYIAPEVINRQVTTASDLWSLGVVMYVCLAGRLPFPGHTTDEIFSNVLKKDLRIF